MTTQAKPTESGAPETLTVEGDEIHAVSPEGVTGSMKIAELLEYVAPPRIDTCGSVLPDGVKCVIPVPRGAIVVHQTPPRVHSFKWIATDSPPFGSGTTYREVSIALPYLIVLAVFDGAPGGPLHLANTSECFFSNSPLDIDGLDTELQFPALLNCSRFPIGARSKPLSWICVQNLPASAREGAKSPSAAIRSGLGALLHHLLETGFNLSSEHHEVSSWYSETVAAEVDPRIASVEAWEQASAEDPLFALEVPWLSTGRTLGEIAQLISNMRRSRRMSFTTAGDLARVIFQRRPSGPDGTRAR